MSLLATGPGSGTTLLLGVLLLAAICLSALYSGSETGLYAVNRLRLELRCEKEQDHLARILRRLVRAREVTLSVLLLGNNIANEAAAMLAAHIAGHWVTEGKTAVVATVVLTPVMFVVGEALPKHLFRQHSETWTYGVSRFLVVSRWLLAPLWVFVLPVTRIATRWASGRQGGMRGLRHDELALERLLVAGDSSIEPVRETALEMGSRRRAPVHRSMVPFDEMQWLPADATASDLRRKLESTAHTRYPLREADGSFLSYVHFLDPFLKDEGQLPLARSARPLVELEPDCPLDEALGRLEGSGSRVGVVKGPGATPLGFVLAGDVVATLLSLDTVDS